MKHIRTRFAPSPTGYIHVGNVRAALFPWLLAKQKKGDFILRIEDTDQARFVEGATDLILDTLEWLGLDWDEGPRRGGSYGPYFQSERRKTYKEWGQKLIDKGLAYADPYTPEEVQAFREEARNLKKPFLYRNHRPDNPPKWDGSQPLRLKVAEPKRYTWHDPVMGELSAGEEALDDFILIKADGLPTYNFAHIIDDYEMGVTHVIRGLEYVSSIPRYLSLYEALEIEPPTLVCLPHIMAADGKKKLGKRDGAKSVIDYRADGILPEAMLNFLASLGWNDGTEQEIFSKKELIEKFELSRVQKSGARFDEGRLLWMNGQWIRRLPVDDLYNRVEDYWPASAKDASDSYKKQVLKLVQDRLKTLAELPIMTEYFFTEPSVNLDLISTNKQLKKITLEDKINLLRVSLAELQKIENWNANTIQDTLNQLLEATGQKPGILFSLIRISTTWAPFSPQLNETLELLGKQTSCSRVEQTIEAIGS
ncbi:glutamate--tRNA ligase [Candidatus Saccharibacteria bacterium]|jgi:glutamyl-tRNA synthetase|nr:glutamate--tRNA ligase [Candidatus Saccharibacteria bacterium]